jgi:beta-lactamase class A
MKRNILIYSGVVILAVGSGYLAGRHITTTPSSSQVLRENSSEYKFINPLLLTQSSSNIRSPSLATLQSKLQTVVDAANQDTKVDNVSVYFRNMNSGEWTGVNENDTYAPGSMLKVAILIGYLNEADSDPSILDTQYNYDPQIDEGQYFKPASMLSPGLHTVRDLLKNMIIESDNTATLILANRRPDLVQNVYTILNLPNPEVGADFMSPLQYAEFWRVLYNASYLSKPNSEEALDLLSLTTFNEGLVSGLPADIRVAHKFGEHTNVSSTAPPVHELHDCGIIYPPGKDPYFLCVMTRGGDFPALEQAISSISKLVWTSVTS